MKKVLSILIISIILATCTTAYAKDLSLEGQAAVLMDFDTKEILYEKNMDMKLYPASTTKIMTAILALEHGSLDDIVTIDQEVVSLTEGSHIALEPGEKLTLEQMLNALLIPSANDAALGLAKHISGSVEGFAKLMNEKADALGATNTNFINPNGLHEDNHYTTAHDLALIAQYAMNNETFRGIVDTVTYQIEPTNKKEDTRYLKNTNKLLFSSDKIYVDGNYISAKYEGASGVKTGTTGPAQYCLVSYAEREGQRLIAVVLKSSGNGVYSDSHKLLNYGFNNYNNATIGFKNEFIENIKIEDGLHPYVAGILGSDFVFPLLDKDLDRVDVKINLRGSLVAPINKGDILGNAEYYLDGRPIGKVDILSTMDVELDPMTKTSNKILSKWYLIVFALIIILRIVVLQKRMKKRTRRRSYRVPYGIK